MRWLGTHQKTSMLFKFDTKARQNEGKKLINTLKPKYNLDQNSGITTCHLSL